jgi:hypothetical protein
MATIAVKCPTCGAALHASTDSLGQNGRCPGCGAVFCLGEQAAQENDVMGWLNENEPVPPTDKPARRRPDPPQEPEKLSARLPVRLGHLDEMGVFLLFGPSLLYQEEFRVAFPQRCIICNGHEHLLVHRVVWSNKLPARGKFGMRESYASTVHSLSRLGRPAGRQLLAKLEPIESMPEPFCLPFPYYVCRNCSAVGAVVTDVRRSGKQEECELGIFSLCVAQDLVRIWCGEDCPAYGQIHQALRESRGDAWRAMPLAVRSRIRQWYRPLEGEHFLGYVPDGDFAKTEAGLAGLVLTDQRLVCRKYASLVELPLSEQLVVHLHTKDGQMQLNISGKSGKTANLATSDATSGRLRTLLQGHKVKWVE